VTACARRAFDVVPTLVALLGARSDERMAFDLVGAVPLQISNPERQRPLLSTKRRQVCSLGDKASVRYDGIISPGRRCSRYRAACSRRRWAGANGLRRSCCPISVGCARSMRRCSPRTWSEVPPGDFGARWRTCSRPPALPQRRLAHRGGGAPQDPRAVAAAAARGSRHRLALPQCACGAPASVGVPVLAVVAVLAEGRKQLVAMELCCGGESSKRGRIVFTV
jgi:hypothetical protein